MLEECTAVFGRILKKESDQWFLNQYVPKNGTYLLINMEQNFECVTEPIDIYTDKKTCEIQGENNAFFRDIQYMDYYSKLVEMNKPIDSTKTIHSNNLYSFFVKKDALEEKLKNHTIDKSVDGYYGILKNPFEKYKKSNDRILYEQVEQTLGKVNKNVVEQIEQWMKSNLESLIMQNNIDLNRKDYLKIFFVQSDMEKSKELICTEGKRYILPNIFNKNDYNKNTSEGIKGVPSNNMGMNSKKPYLENKTRKTKVPYELSLDRVLLQAQFFDYLGGQAAKGKNNIYVDLEKDKIQAYTDYEKIQSPESGIFLRIQQGKELEIHQIIRISGAGSFAHKAFYLKNVMEIEEKVLNRSDFQYGRISSMQDLEKVIDDIFFSKHLRHNYFTKPEDISINENVQEKMLLRYREQLWAWFYQGKEQNVGQMVQRLGPEMIFDSLTNVYKEKAKHQINLYISLMDYLENGGRYEKNMNEVRRNLKEHIDCKEDWEFSSEEEYYYAVGQLFQLFFELNKSAKKNWSYINPILHSKSNEIIKEKLLQLFTKYNYAIEVNNTALNIVRRQRIANLYEHIMLYPKLKTVNGYMISVGFVANSLFYEKKTVENQ